MWKKLIEIITSWFKVSEKPKMHRNSSIPKDDYEYNEIIANKQEKIDTILDKISKKGVDSLSAEEKQFLDKESGNI